jgi:uncharacterized protein (TIGR03437 family)
MWVRYALLVSLVSTAVLAQQQVGFPPANIGVPYTYTLPYAAAIEADLQMAQSIGSVMGVSITVGFFITGGSLPPGLSFAPYGVFSGTPTAAGTYNFSITYEFKVSGPGFPGIDISSPASPGAITVQGASGPPFSVQPGGLSFSYVAGAAASSQFVSVVNQGSAAAPFSATVSTRSGGNWLSAPTASGSAPAFGQGSIAVTADPTGLAPGVYTGYVSISVSQGATQFNVPVLLTITGATQVISLSQTGLSFQAVAGASAPPPQSFSVLNAGIGSLTWTAAASTLSGGSWLTETPVAGASGSGAPPVVQAHVNPAGLAAGNYYGQVQIASAGVDNSPQSVSVVLTVLASTANPAPLVAPTGLIFVGAAGGANPAAQTVQIANLSSTALPYTSLTSYSQGTNWLTAPASGTVTAAQPLNISVQPKIAGLAAGVYSADLALYFAETATTTTISHVAIVLVVTPGAGVSPKVDRPRQASACTATKLLPVFTQLGQSFTATAAWPTSLEVTVVDDCGAPMTSGSVVATFSSGDPAATLTSLPNGRWTGTWQPRASPTAPVTITAHAQEIKPAVAGTASIGGNLLPNTTTPNINDGGVVSAASLGPPTPAAPGSNITILGTNLGQAYNPASGLPLPTIIGNTQVSLAGMLLPLQFTETGQINAIVPYNIPINTTHQMIVQSGTTYSVPVPVTIAAVQPAVYTQDGSGTGAAVVFDTMADGTPFEVNAANPATGGDMVVINCSGLGVVSPAVDAGTAGPESPLAIVMGTVTVTIAGMDAPVVSANLAPDVAGVYQVAAMVPMGYTPALNAPLVVTVNGQDSPAVTIALQ